MKTNFGEAEGMVPPVPRLSLLRLHPKWFGLSLLSQSKLLFLAVSLSLSEALSLAYLSTSPCLFFSPPSIRHSFLHTPPAG